MPVHRTIPNPDLIDGKRAKRYTAQQQQYAAALYAAYAYEGVIGECFIAANA
jgi:hypothetical protein